MTSALQNRLVGTIIVVALVVILLPEFLDGEKRTNEQNFVNVPPVLEMVEVKSAKNIDLNGVEQDVIRPIEVLDDIALDSEDVGSQQSTVDNSDNLSSNTVEETRDTLENTIDSADEVAATNPALEQSTDPLDDIQVRDSGWVVQLGSFRHEKNVKALLKILNDAGYRAYSNPVMTSVGQLNKVFVGPELDKGSLERALPHLQEITQLKGKITAFEVSAK